MKTLRREEASFHLPWITHRRVWSWKTKQNRVLAWLGWVGPTALGSLTQKLGAFRWFQKNSPHRMGKWHNFFPGTGLDNRSVWLKGLCSAGPPLTSFMAREKTGFAGNLYWLKLYETMGVILEHWKKNMAVHGLCPFLLCRQGYIRDKEKNKQKLQETHPHRVPPFPSSLASRLLFFSF